MNYIALKNNTGKIGGYSVVPLREEDIFDIKNWRNAQMDILRTKKVLTDEDQIKYFNEAVKPQFTSPNPSQILFSYLLGVKCVGYGGLTNIDWGSGRAELSFLLNPEEIKHEEKYNKHFSTFIKLIKQAVFDDLGLKEIFTETYDIRPFHVSVLEKNGFVPTGKIKDSVNIGGKLVDSLLHKCVKGS